ncbi:transposase [Crenobacter sp. SG2303]|uniref:Transposase n=1 Tax=Crenobacter oryzisoli TaxID=3056844 RepID=A0ABT7XND3_9NEIS|nr:transposase [Crenobacter sp. SG2303]MDN0075069.1 transposase [Crenobacter sp. SG2303]
MCLAGCATQLPKFYTNALDTELNEEEENKKAIELFFLPSYSPELNPDEYLNGDLKARMSAGAPVRSDGQLQGKVLSHLRSLQKQPARIRSYFRHEKIRYAA